MPKDRGDGKDKSGGAPGGGGSSGGNKGGAGDRGGPGFAGVVNKPTTSTATPGYASMKMMDDARMTNINKTPATRAAFEQASLDMAKGQKVQNFGDKIPVGNVKNATNVVGGFMKNAASNKMDSIMTDGQSDRDRAAAMEGKRDSHGDFQMQKPVVTDPAPAKAPGTDPYQMNPEFMQQLKKFQSNPLNLAVEERDVNTGYDTARANITGAAAAQKVAANPYEAQQAAQAQAAQAQAAQLGAAPQVAANPYAAQSAAKVDPAVLAQAAQVGPAAQANINFQQFQAAQQNPAAAQQIGQPQVAQDFRNVQSQLAGQLQAQASGQAPSLAEMQMRNASEQSIAQQMAMARSQGSMNPNTLRAAMQNSAQLQSQAANQAGMLRLQEQQQAQQALGSLAGTARQGDVQTAQMGQQASEFNASAQNQVMQQNLANQQQTEMAKAQAMQAQGLQNAELQQQSNLTQAQLQQQAGLANQQAQNEVNSQNAQLSQQKLLSDSSNSQQSNMQNAQIGAQYGMKQADLTTQVGMQNAQQQNYVNQFNAGQQNDLLSKKMGYAQSANITDAEAANRQQLQSQSLGSQVDLAKAGAQEKESQFARQLNQQGTIASQQIQQKALDSGMDYQAKIANAQTGQQNANTAERKNDIDEAKNDTEATQGWFKTGGEVLGSIVQMSDKRTKTNIKDGSKKTQEFLDALQPYNYNYKMDRSDEPERLGVMAQDVEKSEMGSKMVKSQSFGKTVDKGEVGFGAVLASLSQLNDRLKKMEKGSK